MEDIHPVVWISLTVAVGATAWLIEGKPGDEKRERQIYRVERIALVGIVICVVVIAAAGLTVWVQRLMAP